MGKKKNVQPPPSTIVPGLDSKVEGEALGVGVGEGVPVIEEVKKEGVKPFEVLYCQGELLSSDVEMR